MAWTPHINVFDERSIKYNLIGYFEANQSDALIWANDGTALPVIQKFHKSPQLVTVFPALTFLQSENQVDFEDILTVDFAMLIEFAHIGGKQDEVADRSPKYAMALNSLLTNVPETTFLQDSIIGGSSVITGIQTQFDVQGKYKNQFIDVFQVRVGWRIIAAAYN